ncbi:MAG: cyclase, partial [Merismopedia sp. SIO2A8]|nr:cyclase [Merismopedia sp. SIO2A8]
MQSVVDIKIEKLEGRQWRVFAKIQIPYSVEQVWQVITDYETFTEFMPGLIQSKRLDNSTRSVRIEQVRNKIFMGMKVSARSVFDIEEKFPHEIHYQLIEGDMKALSGYWGLEPWSSSESKTGIDLIYNFLVSPKRILPVAL